MEKVFEQGLKEFQYSLARVCITDGSIEKLYKAISEYQNLTILSAVIQELRHSLRNSLNNNILLNAIKNVIKIPLFLPFL